MRELSRSVALHCGPIAAWLTENVDCPYRSRCRSVPRQRLAWTARDASKPQPGPPLQPNRRELILASLGTLRQSPPSPPSLRERPGQVTSVPATGGGWVSHWATRINRTLCPPRGIPWMKCYWMLWWRWTSPAFLYFLGSHKKSLEQDMLFPRQHCEDTS